MAEVIRFALCVYILHTPHYLLCCAPFLEQLKIKRRTMVFIILFTGAVMALIYSLRVSYWPNWKKDQFLFLLLFYIVYFIIYRLSFEMSIYKMFYIFLVVQSYSSLLNIAGKFIDVWLYPSHMDRVGETTYTMIVAVLMLLTYPVLFKFFKNTFGRVFQSYPDKDFWKLCITPILFFVTNMIYQNALFEFFAYPEFYDILFLMFILILLIGFITYYLTLHTSVDVATAMQVRSEMENQLLLQAQHYQQLTENIQNAYAARHDMHHHLSVLSAYLKNNDKEGLQEYLSDYINTFPNETMSTYCQNYAVNAVVNYYLNMAKESGTDLDVMIYLPQDVSIPDSDLCIVFGNILENAARSCRQQEGGQKFIRIRCLTTEGAIILVVDNTFSAAVQASMEKRKKHGIGLRSVQAIAEKWGGHLKYSHENGIFQTSVMMNLL